MRKLISPSIVLATVALLAFAQPAAALLFVPIQVIDNFDTVGTLSSAVPPPPGPPNPANQPNVQNVDFVTTGPTAGNNPTTSSRIYTSINPADTVGGVRQMTATATAGTFLIHNAVDEANSSTYDWLAGVNARGTGELIWDGNAATGVQTNILGMDFSGPNKGVALTAGYDHDFDLSLTIYDGSGNSHTETQSFFGANFTDLVFSMDLYSPFIDESDVAALVVFIDGSALAATGLDVTVDAFAFGSLIPEPSSVILSAIGCCSLVGYGIRRRNSRKSA